MAIDKRDVGLIAALISVLLLWAAVSTADVQDAENAHKAHCEMVALWEADEQRNVPEAQRLGWPNYDERECKP